jgi:bile acid-coenzyme A ligase
MPILPLSRALAYQAARKPRDDIAVAYGEDTLTWRELDARSNARARAFQAVGVRQDDLVAIMLPNSSLFLETAFAIWKCGAMPTNISAQLPPDELAAIVEVARPRLVVGGDAETVRGAAAHIPADFEPDGYSTAELAELNPTYWKSTTSGGSTGRPKVIVIHKPPFFSTETPIYVNGMRPDGAMLAPAALHHGAPFSFCVYSLVMGKRVVGMKRFDAREALGLIHTQRLDWAYLVPTMIHRIWALPPAEREAFDISSLEGVIHTGMKIAPWLKEAWLNYVGPHKVYEIYGGSEGQGSTLIRGDEWLAHKGSVGKPSAGSRVRIVDPDGADCAPGVVGEIFFMPASGPGTTYHYIGASPRVIDGGWESIGDLGWLDEDGYLFLADRRHDLIVRAGANIYPAEVEAALESHPGVACAIVVGLPDDALGQRVHAVIEASEGVDHAELAGSLPAHVARKLTRYKCPASYEITDQRLRDDAGKARRSAIRDAALARMAGAT